MSVQVQLKNGVIMDAVMLPDGSFEVLLAKGKSHVYTPDRIRRVIPGESQIDGSDNTPVITNPKEVQMIYHYMAEFRVGGVAVHHRFITNKLDPAVEEAYVVSLATKRPHKGVFAIQQGNYRFSLLEKTLMNHEKIFKITIVENGVLPLYGESKIQEWIGRATFAFANAGFSFFVNVDDSEWGLAELGLTIKHSKKSAKRLQEVLRSTEMFLYTEDITSVGINLNPFLQDPVEYHDGMSYIRQSFAIRLAKNVDDARRRGVLIHHIRTGVLVRVTLRVLTPSGLIKGDAIIVPDNQISTDIVTHPENLKDELCTTGFIHISMWEHAPMHMAVWDDQSIINFGRAMPKSKQMADLNRIHDDLMDKLAMGEIPEWLTLGEKDRNKDGSVNFDQLSTDVNKQYIKIQASGMDIRSFQNQIYMSLNGVTERMEGPFVNAFNAKFYKKTWIPMSNAVLGAVVTYESATKMGGFEFPGQDPDTVFYDSRVGMVIPGRRFVETFDAHGTWDLDDNAKFIWIQLYSTMEDDSVHRGITIPVDWNLPDNADNAVDAFLVVRSPNGPGEYSIERPDFDTLCNLPVVDMGQIVKVDLANMPLPQEVLLVGIQKTGLNPSTTYTKQEMTRFDAVSMVTAQMSNPGIGRFCNAMMVWGAVNGPSFPPTMAEVMGEIVDASQQGYDISSFEVIEGQPRVIIDQLLEKMTLDPTLKLDKTIAATRLNDPEARAEVRPRLIRGRLTEIQEEYVKVIASIKEAVSSHSMMWRTNTPLVQDLRRRGVSSEMAQFSEQFFSEYMGKMALATNLYKAAIKESKNPFIKASLQYAKKLAMEEVVAEMVDVFMQMDVDKRHRYIVGFYAWIVSDHGKTAPHGLQDRLICQPNSQGLSLLDILIEGLEHYGLIVS